MTDTNDNPPHDTGASNVPPVPPAYPVSGPAAPLTPPTGSPYGAAPGFELPTPPPTAPPYGAPPSYGTSPAAPSVPAGPYGAAPGTAPSAAPAYGAPNYPAAPAYGYGYAPIQKTNGLSIASLIASILGVIGVLPFVGSLAGAIMGHISLGQIKSTGESGRGMALAGVIVGWAGVAMWVVLGILLLFFIGLAASSGSSYGA